MLIRPKNVLFRISHFGAAVEETLVGLNSKPGQYFLLSRVNHKGLIVSCWIAQPFSCINTLQVRALKLIYEKIFYHIIVTTYSGIKETYLALRLNGESLIRARLTKQL